MLTLLIDPLILYLFSPIVRLFIFTLSEGLLCLYHLAFYWPFSFHIFWFSKCLSFSLLVFWYYCMDGIYSISSLKLVISQAFILPAVLFFFLPRSWEEPSLLRSIACILVFEWEEARGYTVQKADVYLKFLFSIHLQTPDSSLCLCLCVQGLFHFVTLDPCGPIP